jgi:hypothetical protein
MKKYLPIAILIFITVSCEKENTRSENAAFANNAGSSAMNNESTNIQSVPGGTGTECTIAGNFVGTIIGTSPANNGIIAPVVYQFMDNNFLRGASTLSNPWVSFGGCRVTCDSVIWNSYNTINSGYYIHKGRFSNNRTVISGTWINLNNPTIDYGNLTVNKQ